MSMSMLLLHKMLVKMAAAAAVHTIKFSQRKRWCIMVSSQFIHSFSNKIIRATMTYQPGWHDRQDPWNHGNHVTKNLQHTVPCAGLRFNRKWQWSCLSVFEAIPGLKTKQHLQHCQAMTMTKATMTMSHVMDWIANHHSNVYWKKHIII